MGYEIRKDSKMTLKIFWPETLGGWGCHGLRWGKTGGEAGFWEEDQELSLSCFKSGVSARHSGVLNRELHERNWNARERSGLEMQAWLSSAEQWYLKP